MAQTQKEVIESERWDSLEGELAMEAGHKPAWNAMINQMEEKDLTTLNILDFGCNRGGFLRMLYNKKPYKIATGVDIAKEALSDARMLSKDNPVTFDPPSSLDNKKNNYDIMFSHEVIYLLPDLKQHAEQAYNLLKNNGVYYLAIGEYTENPLWPRWDTIVREFSPVPPQSYSLQYIARTFQETGFKVSVTKLKCDGFFDYDATENRYLQSPIELVNFMCDRMMYFRLQK